MIVTECYFDPVRDIAPVDEFGFIDLKTALSNSVVPSQMPESDTDYNGIEDPQKILGKPHDVFEALDAQKALEVAAAAAGDGEQESE